MCMSGRQSLWLPASGGVDLAAPMAEISTVWSHWKGCALLWDSQPR